MIMSVEYEAGQQFIEYYVDDVDVFTIIEVNDESPEYRIAEEWHREDGTTTWVDYWLPEDDLDIYIEMERCEPDGEPIDESALSDIRDVMYDSQVQA